MVQSLEITGQVRMVISTRNDGIFTGHPGVDLLVISSIGTKVDTELLREEFVIKDVLVLGDITSSGFFEKFLVAKIWEDRA
jgi:hypothetical protein